MLKPLRSLQLSNMAPEPQLGQAISQRVPYWKGGEPTQAQLLDVPGKGQRCFDKVIGKIDEDSEEEKCINC